MTPLLIIAGYLALLLGLGVASHRFLRKTSKDYFVASHSIGPVLLLMSVFGTTMTAFALVGSTGEAYRKGIGVFGLMASWSALIHPAVFYLVGIKLWGLGRRYGYVTQVQLFRARFESNLLGSILFPILVVLVVPYLLIGVLASGSVVSSLTAGAFPEMFAATRGGVPPWLTGLVICGVVFLYVTMGGLRGAAWANTFQTIVFMVMGVISFVLIADQLGGVQAASEAVLQAHPERMTRESMPPLHFMSYIFVPLSVGMFPHLFQHWLTARSAKDFRLTVTAHPVFIMIVWLPCVLLGVWATAALMPAGGPAAGELVVPLQHAPNAELGMLVRKLTSPVMTGLLGAGILAAIMSSLDSQFLCLGTMFTHDVVVHLRGESKVSEASKIRLARIFIAVIILITYALSLGEPRRVFTLGVWCFSGFAALFPLVLATVYWRRATRAGAIACVLATAATWLGLFVRADFGKHEGLVGDVMPVAVMFAVSCVALVGVSLLTSPPSKETLAKFFPAAADA